MPKDPGFSVPRSRGYDNLALPPDLRDCPKAKNSFFCNPGDSDTMITDMILHALIARATYANNRVIELKTEFDPKNKIIELNNCPEFFDLLDEIEQGERFQRFICWLVKNCTSAVESPFFCQEFEEECCVTVNHDSDCFPPVDVVAIPCGNYGDNGFGNARFGEGITRKPLKRAQYEVCHLDRDNFQVCFACVQTGTIVYG